jgi:hypothetical protein
MEQRNFLLIRIVLALLAGLHTAVNEDNLSDVTATFCYSRWQNEGGVFRPRLHMQCVWRCETAVVRSVCPEIRHNKAPNKSILYLPVRMCMTRYRGLNCRTCIHRAWLYETSSEPLPVFFYTGT